MHYTGITKYLVNFLTIIIQLQCTCTSLLPQYILHVHVCLSVCMCVFIQIPNMYGEDQIRYALHTETTILH